MIGYFLGAAFFADHLASALTLGSAAALLMWIYDPEAKP